MQNAGPQAGAPGRHGLRDRLALLAVLAAAYLAGLYPRLLELPLWAHPLLAVDGEPLMATHDAYAWLAGVRGLGTGAGSAMAGLIAGAAGLFGVTPGQAAFWIPALAAPLVGVAAALWARTLAGPAAALGAGMLAATAPGFLQRTRLGFCDTDIATLLFPLVQCWLLAHWLDPWLRRPGARGTDAPQGQPGPLLPLLAGLAMALGGGQWHARIADYGAGALWLAAGLALLAARPGARPRLLAGLGLCGLAAFGGVPGLVAALALAGLLHAGKDAALPAPWRPLAAAALLGLALACTPQLPGLAKRVTTLATTYARPQVEPRAPREAVADTALYPGVTQSVIEARAEPLDSAMAKLSPRAWASWAGLAGFAVVAALRPVALLLAPLALVVFFGATLGTRVTMFGGPAVALGLAVPLAWGLRRLTRGRPWGGAAQLAAQALLAGALLVPAYQAAQALRPAPVLTVQHARALKALGAQAEPGAGLWTWWDWGYAAQYYAGLPTFADGARHGGQVLYPLALAMTTPVPRQARQMMQYAALRGYRPWETFDRRPAAEVREFIASLGSARYDLREAPPQYLLTTWEALRLAHWITYYGTWDVTAGQGVHGSHTLLGRFALDGEAGMLLPGEDAPIPLHSAEELTATGRTLRTYDRGHGPRLLINRPAGQAVLLDDLTYNGMLVRLLLCAPDDPEIAEHFRLVYEGFPLVRIWQARREEAPQPPQEGGPGPGGADGPG
ncbi:STT3 domain-containing protein [Desulfocurvus vexinensis]|uniref:STT3 domain-containing protein n=1 Tax=Desulfocurvus vexinensis TaxID=399548 RepID=UPI00048FC62C|nr:STT3 domain-containing protein [Desulfocurvus vexinensis]